MTTTPIIGIMGFKQSGKDSYASRLVDAHGFTRFALADPMRDFALALDPLIAGGEGRRGTYRLSDVIRSYGWDTAKETIPEVRRTLQCLGTEAGRDVIGADFWINVTKARIAECVTPVVVTDIRFPNEYEWIKNSGGYLVRVIRPGTSGGEHSSEAMAADLDNFPADLTVSNLGTLEDLYSHADTVARVVLSAPFRADTSPVSHKF